MATEYTTTQPYYYSPALFVGRVVNIIVGIIEAVILVRIVLELLGANAASPFIAWVYGATNGLVAPFSGAFPNVSLGGAAFIDITAILAMIVYAVVGWVVMRLSYMLFG